MFGIKTKTITLTLGAAATALTMAAAPATYAMDQKLGGVVGCKASGSKQEVGAVLGGLLGAVAGSNLAKNDRGTGTALGAVVGAGAGSYVGCKMQKSDAAKEVGGVYKSGGYRYAQTVEAAPLVKVNRKYVARSTLNVRAAASTRGERLGALESGATFQALGRTGDGKWILVGQDGVGVGYVSSAYVYRA
ncbi:SH3 domain-containing protein [Caulobacter sp.]|uniref:SH3 domain-containing protein n=1 Tax=Caulobacter sp. TaxID=78 RepID=UPI002B47EF64|nr:SH3 domain-containing protein [Caulobacter sp.]HJV42510.1 SH3 domain-containing protein [Caulobacter sp.]